jgi:spore maturation protein CgeB
MSFDEQKAKVLESNGNVGVILADERIKNEEDEKIKKFKTDFVTITHAVFQEVKKIWEKEWAGRVNLVADIKFTGDCVTAKMSFEKQGVKFAEIDYSIKDFE